MGKTVLITGGCGFLGGHLAVALHRRGYHIVAFDKRAPMAGSEIEWLWKREHVPVDVILGDVSDAESVFDAVRASEASHLVHTAVINNVEILRDDPVLVNRVNVGGTLNVLEAARRLGVKKVVDASSISVYAPKQYEPMDETHPVLLPDEGPTLLSYSSSKLASEAYGMHYWATYGVDFIALRFSAIYGLGMVYPMYIKPMVEETVCGRPVRFAGGAEAARDYTYVDDAVQGIIRALETVTRSHIFNISTGSAPRRADEIIPIIKGLRPDADIVFGDQIDPVEARTATTRGVLSIRRAVDELGFAPQYPLETGVEAYFRDYEAYRGAMSQEVKK